MAVNEMKIDELDQLKTLPDRLNSAEAEINKIFEGFTIPEDITDINDKLSYALIQIGDDQKSREELKKKIIEVEEKKKLAKPNIEEDFIGMTKAGNKRIEKYAEQLNVLEKELIDQQLTQENKRESIKKLDEEIKSLEDKKNEIQGADGRGGEIAEEMSKSVDAKKATKKIEEERNEVDKKIQEIDDKIKELNEANQNTNDPVELKKNADEIAALQGERSNLMDDRNNLSNRYQEQVDEKGLHEENIRKLQGEVLNLDSEIKAKSTKKNLLENELRLMPIVEQELNQSKANFEKNKEEFNKTVEDMAKSLGIDMSKINTPNPEETKKEETNKEKKEETKKEDKTSTKGGNTQTVNEQFIPNVEDNHPVIDPKEKKQENFDFIMGSGLTSEDRLDRIRSKIAGRDYEAMVSAFKELENSPVKLTRTERNDIKEMMKTDKENLADIVKDIDINKLDSLLRSVGIAMTKSELDSLNKTSFEGKSNATRGSYGILDGFSQMSDKDKSKWEDVIKSYSNKKNDMTEEQINDFEKYILTPIKFGTLQEQSKSVCKNPIIKFFSNVKDKRVEDIRSVIASVEVPEGQEHNSRKTSKDFVNNLMNQTQQEPPYNGGQSRTGKNTEPPVL